MASNKRGTDGNSLPAGNVIPITSASPQKAEKHPLQDEQLLSELDQVKQENLKLHILNAQQQKDMEGMWKKYGQLEQENEALKGQIKALVSTVNKLEADNQMLRRKVYGTSAENMDTAGNEQSNTTALQEGTSCGTDSNTNEAKMAEGVCTDKSDSENTSEEGTKQNKRQRSEKAEKTSRPNNIRKKMEENLPTVRWYPLSPELIRKFDKLYGKDQWRFMNWEGTQHLVHIPEMYINQIDYVPILCLKDNTPVRPFTEHPEEFQTNILPHSVLSSSEFANIVHKKFALGIPLYRQEQDLQQMCDIHLGRQDMADWIIRAGTQGFVQVYDYLIRQELACKYHNIDETFLQVILDGRAAATKSYLWVHKPGELADPEHPIVVFIYEPTRATEHLRKYFPEDIAAVISCDHYIAYETLESERDNILIALCWMHVRRRFFYAFDLIANIKGLTNEQIRASLEAKLLLKIGEIYKEEMKLKNFTAEKRKEERVLKVKPLVDEFFAMLHEMNPDDPSLSHLLQDAVKYTLDAEEKLKRFLDDPCISIDNGSAERAIRGVATGRRAWLFCDTPEGAKALALFYSLVTTARLNQANDYYYIKYLCEQIPGGLLGPVNQLSDEKLESLMPWSEEYKAYEKHEIESRFDTVTIESDMKKPTKEDILKMRQQMEAEEFTAVPEDTAQEAICQDDPSIQSDEQQNKSFPSCPEQTKINENATEEFRSPESACSSADEKMVENKERRSVEQQICSPPDFRNEKKKQRRTG